MLQYVGKMCMHGNNLENDNLYTIFIPVALIMEVNLTNS